MAKTEKTSRYAEVRADRPLRSSSTWIAAIRIAALALLAALAVRTLIAEPFSIPSPSMMPTLLPHDYIVVAKHPYGYSAASLPWGAGQLGNHPTGRIGAKLPERGDIVVFVDPLGSGEHFIKRVIALPGETVAVSDGTVYVDDVPLPRRRVENFRFAVTPATPCTGGRLFEGDPNSCDYAQYQETLPGGRTIRIVDMQGTAPLDTFSAAIVPAGHLFVMGDNRDNSEDSRLPRKDGGFGMVPLAAVVGRADWIFFSSTGPGDWREPASLVSSIRFARLGAVH
ncbi:signal peptidase I [Pacificimonas flava]|uniref:Signal peptidase I n=1 Tax=Pacificimonas flava TaxID=1234595 RepID=M2TRT4_9SPHN|nr:signal peptidase I [Pacificimonas flava]EMD84496.1 Signal peptidase I [Pacificimonas flava]MBB5279632.1 signal peptidase I [Pacificimonas flava]